MYFFDFHSRTDTHPPDLLLPPRPGTVPPILTWPAPTPPGMATVPGNSLAISGRYNSNSKLRVSTSERHLKTTNNKLQCFPIEIEVNRRINSFFSKDADTD